jgi:hypothetical protein
MRKFSILLIGLAGLLALVAPVAADAAKPWQGHWHGSGTNPAAGKGRFKVDFDVTRHKKVVGMEVRNWVTSCYDGQSRVYFPLTEIDDTDRLSLGDHGTRNYWDFRVAQTFDDGFGFNYTAEVVGHINTAWTRVTLNSFVAFRGSALGPECIHGAEWTGTHG